MVRVLQVFAQLNMGGAENMLMSIYRSIDRSKVQFDFVENESNEKSAFADEITRLGGRIYRVPRFKLYNRASYERAWEGLLAEHPEIDIVHAHHTAPAYVFLPIARKYGRMTIAHSHTAYGSNSLKSRLKVYLRGKISRKADKLLACSDNAGRWMFGDAEFTVFPNAIDIGKFTFSSATRERVRRENGWTESFVIGHIGRFTELKNHGFLLRVFAETLKLRSNSVLALVGEGELRGQIEREAAELGIADRVRFMGVRTDVNELLQGFDAFVFPSRFEGLPVTLVEAQCAGLRCFVSDTVTGEVNITELVENLSLQQTAAEWAERITAGAADADRASYAAQVKAAGYDVAESAAELLKLYTDMAELRDKPGDCGRA